MQVSWYYGICSNKIESVIVIINMIRNGSLITKIEVCRVVPDTGLDRYIYIFG